MEDHYDILHQIVFSRHSCRSFSCEALSDEQTDRILEIASRSPFASGRSNWKIMVVRDRNVLESLAGIVRKKSEEISAGMDPEEAAFFLRYASSFTFFEKAGALFIPYCRETSTMKSILRENVTDEICLWEHDNLTKSLSCVAMLILLAAESLGLGACYMTGPLIAGKALGEALGIKDSFIIGALVPVGHKNGGR